MKLTSALDSIYLAAVDDEDDFEDETPEEPAAPLIERGRKPGWTPPQDNPFEWQREYMTGIWPELRHDNENRQLIHVAEMPDGTFATHQVLSPDAPSNPGARNSKGEIVRNSWRVNRFFHDQNGQLIPFTDEDGNTVFSESTDHPDATEAGYQFHSNRDWDKFRTAGWARPSRNEERYTKLLEGDPKIMLDASLDGGSWRVSAHRVRRNPDARQGEDPYTYEHIGTSYHPDAESAIAGVKGRKTLR